MHITAHPPRRSGRAQFEHPAPTLAQTLRRLQPISLLALLATLVLLFGFQGEQIVRQPLIIAVLAVPIIIQVYLNAGIAYAINRSLGVPHNVACPSALIGASNFFESRRSRGDRAVWLSVGRGDGDRGGRARRSAGHALRRADRVADTRLV